MPNTLPAAPTDDRPLVNIGGEKVALGPLHAGLLPLLVRWDNDFATVDRGGDEPRPRSPEAAAAFWEPLFRGERADWIGFAIYEPPELRPIGVANLRDDANPHRTAEWRPRHRRCPDGLPRHRVRAAPHRRAPPPSNLWAAAPDRYRLRRDLLSEGQSLKSS